MKPIRLALSWLAAITIVVFLVTGTAALAAVDFDSDCPDTPVTDPVPCDDDTPSLGRFHIWVNLVYRPQMVGYPGYNNTTGVLTSPNLFDRNTIIGRSAAHLEGSVGPNSDIGGTPVGDLGTPISDANFTVVPPAFEITGGREIHTEIVDLQMTEFPPIGGMVLRAGATPYGLTLSPGEIESTSASGSPADDLPDAQSFFNAYVEVDIPAVAAFPCATFFNPAPFPTEIARRLIGMFSFVGDTVLDPFLGIGNTSLAAIEMHRSSIGFEIEPEYVEVVRRRIGTPPFDANVSFHTPTEETKKL